MNAYLSIAKLTIMEVAAYPFRLWGYLLTRLITLGSFMLVWKLIFATQSTIEGYNFADMCTYYVLAMIITELTLVWRTIEQFSDYIHRGTLSTLLLKPINVSGLLLAQSLSFRLIRAFLPIFFVLVFAYFKPEFVTGTHYSGWFFVSILLSLVVAQFLYASIGLLAFWVTQMKGIRQIIARLVEVLAGTMFPLQLLPANSMNVLHWLPFQYIHYVPISIYLGKFSINEIYTNILFQLLWAITLVTLHQIIWNRGIVRYESVGN